MVKDTGVQIEMVYPEDVPTVHGIKSPITLGGDVIGAIKGPKLDLAYKFIDYILSPEAQYEYTSGLAAGPVNPHTKTLPSDLAPYVLSGDQLARGWKYDVQYISSNMDRILERWQAEVAPLVGKSV
jgi:ABC-type Fe3+ transport system substrate-binding protein